MEMWTDIAIALLEEWLLPSGAYIRVNIKLLHMNNHSNGDIRSRNKSTNREKEHSVTNGNMDWTVRGPFWEALSRI